MYVTNAKVCIDAKIWQADSDAKMYKTDKNKPIRIKT